MSKMIIRASGIEDVDLADLTPRHTQPPCSQHPTWWDLDVGTPEAWHRAQVVCATCPLQKPCHELAQRMVHRGMAPRAVIWAGVGYDNSGRALADIDHYGQPHRTAKQPGNIVNKVGPHTGSAPARTTVHAPATPRRLLTLGCRMSTPLTDSVESDTL